MKLDTKHFGELDIKESEIITFDDGIPGFWDYTQFILINDKNSSDGTESPFCWLQSVDNTDVCFVLMDFARVVPEYNPLVCESDMAGLGEYNPDIFSLLNIAKFPDNMQDASINLKAPIVINRELKKGKQVVCTNEEYSVRHYIFKPTV